MKIIIDDKIPYIRPAMAKLGAEAVYLSGAHISAADVADADALIVRTRTRCDRRLLGGSNVTFVATATIGYDHLDTQWLGEAGISWVSCPGCNAASVAQYVEAVLLLLEREKGRRLAGSTLGIVGCGHVGSRVLEKAEALGMRVLVCDPPLSLSPLASRLLPLPHFVSLGQIAAQADIITFHVPLDETTHHLADSRFFSSLKRRPVIINSSRGPVVDTAALIAALDNRIVSDAIVDTWENEPLIDRELLRRAYIATPHIAGYSADGKVNADNMVIKALCQHFSLPVPPPIVPPSLPSGFVYTGDPLQLYNPLDDSRRLKLSPDSFEQLRGNYPLRREFFG